MSSEVDVRPKTGTWTVSVIERTAKMVRGTAVSPEGEAGWWEFKREEAGATFIQTYRRAIGIISLNGDGSVKIRVNGEIFMVTPFESGRWPKA